MLCRSGPGAPLFAATASNAPHNRSITSSMVAACAFSGLSCDLGSTHACAGLGCPALAPWLDSCEPLSAVSKLSSSCIDIHSTATAFAPPRALCRLGCDWLSPAFLLLRSCLTSVGPVAFRSFVLRVSFAPPWYEQPNRSLRVRLNKLRAHVVATTHAGSGRFRISPLGAGSSPAHALRRFTFVQHVHAPMASTAHPLAGLPAFGFPLVRSWCPTAMHLPLRCWVPSAEAPGLDFHLLFVSHAEHTPIACFASFRPPLMSNVNPQLQMPTTVTIKWFWIDFDPKETKKKIQQKLEGQGTAAHLFPKAVYVIRLKSPFSISYPSRHTPVLYIGEGHVLSRLVSHRKWASRMQDLGYRFGLEVAVCFPRVQKNAAAYKTFEAHLLKVFSDRYGSLPLKNSINEAMAFNHQYNRVATSGILGPGSGAKHMWAIRPLPSNPFQDVFERTHAG